MKLQNWTRDLLIIPIIVGIVIISIQSLATFVLEKRAALDISLEEPMSFMELSKLLEESNFELKTNYVFEWSGKASSVNKKADLPKSEREIKNTAPAPPFSFQVDKITKEFDDLYVYRVKIINSGDVQLLNILTHLEFDTNDPKFAAITFSNYTTPKSIADNIKYLDAEDAKNIKFIYQSLNPGEQDTITVLANRSSEYRVDLRADGYTTSKKWSESIRANSDKWYLYGLFSMLGAIVSMLLKFLFGKYLAKASSSGC